MRKNNRTSFVLILIAALFAISLFLPLARGTSPIEFGLDLSGGVTVTYRPDFSTRLDSHAETPDAELLALAKETLASRLYRSLSTVPDVVVRGDETIVVSIPGVENHREVLELMGETYRLTLRLVSASHDAGVTGQELFRYGDRYLELEPAELSGDMLDERYIQVETGPTGELDPGADRPRVSFRFRPPHDEAFAAFTGEHVGRELAILLDDEVEWSGRIESAIQGSGVLRGSYTLEEATDVARLLRSGSLPVSLEVESVSGIGPSLGQEVRELGFTALALSMAMLVAVLLAAYLHRTWFLIAGVASLFFLLLAISGTVAIFGLTLDMAGIAGLVLSVGMGMDAFLLIFEALERKLGAFTPEQLSQHHDRIVRGLYSFAQEGRVLFHANATTAVVLMLLLTGERLRSFALFLFAGIFASVLTIFATREILKRTHGLLPDSGVDLLGWLRHRSPGIFRFRRLYFALVAIGLVVTGALVLAGGPAEPVFELGADFEEGTQAIVESPSEERLAAALARLEERLPGIEIRRQSLGAPEDGRALITVGTPLGGGQQGGIDWQIPAVQAEGSGPISAGELSRLLAAESVELKSVSSIDSRVSGQRLVRSLSVFVLSFFLLALYFVVLQGPINGALAARAARPLRPGSRLLIFTGILLAVIVDVGVVLAVLSAFRIEVGLPVVAAILTVVGYSVNDSVVLWSHVRGRHQAAKRSASALELVTAGVDGILSRALLTSLSTMVPALAILIVGLRPLEGFAWVMIAGTLAGTLSSIFVVGSFAVRALERETRATVPSASRRPGFVGR
ncbi:MAG: hypothetical protein GY719_43385 [bacterium]|nr:hypothetical protein [bacterium]